MKAFLDSNVLIATFYGDHQHHEASLDLFAQLDRKSSCTAAHTLAEVYYVLTGMPWKNRATPDEALLFLEDVSQRLAVFALDKDEHFRAMKACGGGWDSGRRDLSWSARPYCSEG